MIPSSLFCDTCGAENLPQASFCRTCGHSLQSIGTATRNTATGRLLTNRLLKQRYRILDVVGKGGMGAVYKAEDTHLGNRKVAIKEMSQRGLSPEATIDAAVAFKQEAHILAGLQHPNLPNIYAAFTNPKLIEFACRAKPMAIQSANKFVPISNYGPNSSAHCMSLPPQRRYVLVEFAP